MKKFLIRRDMEGAGSIPKHDLNNAGKGSEEVLEAMRSEGKNIMQEQSYVVGDAIFCVYNADSEELIREHAERSGAPANEISEIGTVIKHNTSVTFALSNRREELFLIFFFLVSVRTGSR